MGRMRNTAGVLWRYVQLKRSYRRVHPAVQSLLPEELEYELQQGCPLFEGIVADPFAWPPITYDEWDPDFLDAIIFGHGTVPELNTDEVERARQFVLHNQGTPPMPEVDGIPNSN